MEPVTHFLTGACIGRAGLNRKTAYATVAAVLAAEAADLDVLWGFAGPVEELKHHRGITHTFIAVPVVAGVVVGAIWVFDRWRSRRWQRKAKASGGKAREPAAPISWGWLFATAMIAALSHLLLDWTNNYGLRPFFPFNPRWYAGSIMFIAEPVLWGLLLLALVVPWILGLADREMGARRSHYPGRNWAVFALAGMVALWCWRWYERAQAQAMVENAQITTAMVTRVGLEPYPVNPFRWHAILETANFYQTAEVNARTGEVNSDAGQDVIYKPTDTPAVEAAKRTLLGQVYLDWGSWAVVRDVGPERVAAMDPPHLPPNRHWTTVEFTDLRFGYSFLGPDSDRGKAVLGGWVYIVDGKEDAGEAMNGREQK